MVGKSGSSDVDAAWYTRDESSSSRYRCVASERRTCAEIDCAPSDPRPLTLRRRGGSQSHAYPARLLPPLCSTTAPLATCVRPSSGRAVEFDLFRCATFASAASPARRVDYISLASTRYIFTRPLPCTGSSVATTRKTQRLLGQLKRATREQRRRKSSRKGCLRTTTSSHFAPTPCHGRSGV